MKCGPTVVCCCVCPRYICLKRCGASQTVSWIHIVFFGKYVINFALMTDVWKNTNNGIRKTPVWDRCCSRCWFNPSQTWNTNYASLCNNPKLNYRMPLYSLSDSGCVMSYRPFLVCWWNIIHAVKTRRLILNVSTFLYVKQFVLL